MFFKAVLVVISLLATLVVTGTLLNMYENYQNWISCINRNHAKRSLYLDKKTIINLYKVNPDRWKIGTYGSGHFLQYFPESFEEYFEDSCIENNIHVHNRSEWENLCRVSYTTESAIWIKLNFFNYWWFMNNLKNNKKKVKSLAVEDTTKELKKIILNKAQKDIDRLRTQAYNEIKEAEAITSEVKAKDKEHVANK